jgi:hypothetical protein
MEMSKEQAAEDIRERCANGASTSDVIQMLDEYISHLRASPSPAAGGMTVPDGWKLVPKEPTLAMIAALGFNGDEDATIGHAAISESVINTYKAMFAAAPSADNALQIDPAFTADLKRSQGKHPGLRRMFDGLLGEVHELKRAYSGDGDVRAEAFDVAVCAYRIATEGDEGGNEKLAAVPDCFAWGAGNALPADKNMIPAAPEVLAEVVAGLSEWAERKDHVDPWYAEGVQLVLGELKRLQTLCAAQPADSAAAPAASDQTLEELIGESGGSWHDGEFRIEGSDLMKLLRAAVAADATDAARYRWLRGQHWNSASLFVVAGGRNSLKLGVDCPSEDRLDEIIDAAFAAHPPAQADHSAQAQADRQWRENMREKKAMADAVDAAQAGEVALPDELIAERVNRRNAVNLELLHAAEQMACASHVIAGTHELERLCKAIGNARALAAGAGMQGQDALGKVKQALDEYYEALCNREHGGVAQDRAFGKIEQALDASWQQYRESKAATREQAQ